MRLSVNLEGGYTGYNILFSRFEGMREEKKQIFYSLELSHHFGVESPQQVNPDLYQIIKIDSGSSFPKPKR